MTSAKNRSDMARAGSDMFLALLDRLREAYVETAGDGDGDALDYVSLTGIVDTFLSDLHREPAERRLGAVRALTALLLVQLDDCVLDLDEWDPLDESEPAFAARAMLERVGASSPRRGRTC